MVTLTYGPRTVTLRDPEFGNGLKVETARLSQRTRGGDLILFRDPAWPVTKTTTLVDFEGVTRVGVITTPAAEVVQTGRGCQFDATFDFQEA
jgi:hypothetical protein